jgi:CRP-like cAMP-binding protein
MRWKEFEKGFLIYDESMKSNRIYQMIDGVIEIHCMNKQGELKISKTFMRGEMFGQCGNLQELR